jgi:tripartite-type tricarboxylate transporter receptor subunit TctC
MSRRPPIDRRGFVAGASLAALAGISGWTRPAVAAPDWPDRFVRSIVPYGPGQGADVLMRLVAQELSGVLGQTVVVDNRAGAGGNIGAAAVAKAAPDGYTLLLGTNATNAANEFLYANLGYHPATDFDAVAMIGMLPMVICSTDPELPTNGIVQLIAKARSRPGSLNVGLPSTTAAVVFAQFVKSAQAPLFGVKYKASGQSMNDVLGGQIPLVIDTVIAARPHIQSGRLKALGITSAQPTDMLPGVKPVAQQGVPGFDLVAWDALFAPRGTPPGIVRTLSEHLSRFVQKPQLRPKLMEIGVEPRYMNSVELTAFVSRERLKWGAIIKEAGINVE